MNQGEYLVLNMESLSYIFNFWFITFILAYYMFL